MTDGDRPRGSRGLVVVITGAGGMGLAVARRLGRGRTVVLADFDERQLGAAAASLRGDGYVVDAVRTDISSADDVHALARAAAAHGRIEAVVHTAGVSPVQESTERIVAVDVVGTALVLDAFEPHVEPGTVAVCIASMAAMMIPVPPEALRRFASTPTGALHELAELDPATMDPGIAYGVAKRANQVRVEVASIAWGRRGGRVVSISPGVISTPMGQAELSGPSGAMMRSLVDMSGTRRLGTPDDIAAAVEFLVSPAASFITGTDLLVDGGVVAAVRSASTEEHA